MKEAANATAKHVSKRPILLKNSPDRSKGPDQQNNVPPKGHSGNNVCQLAYGRNSVPSFRSDFRMVEFFNRIGPNRTLVQHAAKVGCEPELTEAALRTKVRFETSG
jgi:hypothetical protein